MIIRPGGLDDPRVQALLEHHVRSARAETAVGSAHALDLGGLKSPDVDFWSAWEGDTLLGVGALKRLSPSHGEIKSMHTVEAQRGLGVGTAILRHLVDAARAMGMTRLSLETGSWPYLPTRQVLVSKSRLCRVPAFWRLRPGSEQRLHDA